MGRVSDLQASVPAQPRPDKRGLVVIDMQNSYFELPGLAEKKDIILGPVNELIRAARQSGVPVFLVRTQHERDRSTWTINMLEDDQGFAFPGTAQAQFLDELATGDHVEVIKTRDSTFHATDLEHQLQQRDITHLLLCGVSTHSCVFQTATDAFAHNYHVAIATDAITSENPYLADAMLKFLQEEMRQPLLDQQDALALLISGDEATDQP